MGDRRSKIGNQAFYSEFSDPAGEKQGRECAGVRRMRFRFVIFSSHCSQGRPVCSSLTPDMAVRRLSGQVRKGIL